jgi:hypothetical protein
VVRENALTIPATTDIEIYHFLRNKHFGATGPTMKRGMHNHEVAVLGPDDLQNARYESDSDTEDNDEINDNRSQMFTRGNLRRQYHIALVNDPTLQQHYLISGSVTRSLVVRENVLAIPATTDIEIYHFLRNKHFGATGSTMKRGNHEVGVLGPDDLQND